MTDSSLPDSASNPSDEETTPSDEEYEPPRVEALGELPASTGMPASPQSFPEDPNR